MGGRFILCACVSALGALARADDAALTWGGNPELLKGHSTIRMVAERVFIKVGKRASEVNCRFVFRNEGPACDVRIGFPDNGEEANVEPPEDGSPRKPYVGLVPFRSWVDGKEVATTVVPEGKKQMSWHVKVVHFGAHQMRIVRDYYGLWTGRRATMSWRNQAAGDNVYIWTLPYILATGASWKGPIGKAEVIVLMPFSVHARRMPASFNSGDYTHWNRLRHGQIFYNGFARAKTLGRNLVFFRRNIKPTEDDNVMIFWPLTKKETFRLLYPPGTQ